MIAAGKRKETRKIMQEVSNNVETEKREPTHQIKSREKKKRKDNGRESIHNRFLV